MVQGNTAEGEPTNDDIGRVSGEDIAEDVDAVEFRPSVIYAVSSYANPVRNSIFRVHVLRSRAERSFGLCGGQEVNDLSLEEGTVMTSLEQTRVRLPAQVRDILAGADRLIGDDCPIAISDYVEKAHSFTWSATMSNRFLYCDAGDVLVLDPVKGVLAQEVVMKFESEKGLGPLQCAWDARNGMLPVLYRKGANRFLGLVSLKDGSLTELSACGIGADTGALKWVDDTHLLVTQDNILWGVYDITQKKMVASGKTGECYPQHLQVIAYSVRGGNVYGMIAGPSQYKMQRLFPVSQKQEEGKGGAHAE